jgi:ribosomal protein S18 acetylase RimI-like enzyme
MKNDLAKSELTNIQFRPITPGDQDTLAKIYASTRREELAPLLDWSEGQKEAFLRQQFELQHNFYQQHYTGARFELITRGGEVLGRLYVDRREDDIRIVDIALLPEHRGQGIGGAIVQDLLDEAAARDQGRAVSIHVEHTNAALRFYQRLGFREIEDQGIYKLMKWWPAS